MKMKSIKELTNNEIDEALKNHNNYSIHSILINEIILREKIKEQQQLDDDIDELYDKII